MKPLADCRLYTFVDTAYLHGRSAADIAGELCAGGADIIQLRAKGATLQEVRTMALEILPITSQAGVWLVMNDHLEIAREVGAPVCHLGQEDFFDAGHRHISDLFKIPGERPIKIGLSTHAPEQAKSAIDAGADYIAIGPVYATGTKPTAQPVTLEYVHWAAENVNVPWFAIGGITLENLPSVKAAGATRICVVSAILNARSVQGACREFADRIREAPGEG